MQTELEKIANDSSKDLYLYSELNVRGTRYQGGCTPWSFFSYTTLFTQALEKKPVGLTMYCKQSYFPNYYHNDNFSLGILLLIEMQVDMVNRTVERLSVVIELIKLRTLLQIYTCYQIKALTQQQGNAATAIIINY